MSATKTATKTAKKSAKKGKAPQAQAPEQAALTAEPAEETLEQAPAALEQAPAALEQAPAAPGRAPRVEEPRGARTLTGRVVSSKMQKTIAVEIERLVRHPTYGKYIRRTTKLLAHDENGACREGDLVTITPCRPVSRHKSWRLLEVVAKAAER
ncbi:MAG: 30S ribosomal protein S17 [Gammaproteobacteria bacterium]|nr:MAG: 30S ribosomal protein S17 [Gammaproteobacteria bacterium]TLZ56144.1 MAG: 30S ribosomal protein S17 [Gammaproteobacteria bacterium]TLZ62102.1 MAG: 30S ribosomal protein S17 [Gammaproteobacteria bacterium]